MLILTAKLPRLVVSLLAAKLASLTVSLVPFRKKGKHNSVSSRLLYILSFYLMYCPSCLSCVEVREMLLAPPPPSSVIQHSACPLFATSLFAARL